MNQKGKLEILYSFSCTFRDIIQQIKSKIINQKSYIADLVV